MISSYPMWHMPSYRLPGKKCSTCSRHITCPAHHVFYDFFFLFILSFPFFLLTSPDLSRTSSHSHHLPFLSSLFLNYLSLTFPICSPLRRLPPFLSNLQTLAPLFIPPQLHLIPSVNPFDSSFSCASDWCSWSQWRIWEELKSWVKNLRECFSVFEICSWEYCCTTWKFLWWDCWMHEEVFGLLQS